MAYTNIDLPTDYFNTVLWTGNGTLARSITGVGFQPDLVWIKNRSAAEEQLWYDAVRGADKLLRSNNTAGDATTSTTVYFNSFDSDGFTIGTETAMNASGQNIVAWNWLGANSTASNTAGSITSTVSANTTSGFSVVSWTGNGTDGASIGHGLGTTPSSWIIKQRTGTQVWVVYHTGLSATDNYLQLNSANAEATNAPNIWSADSTTLTFPTSYLGTNGSGSDYVGYFFADVKGFSKFGKYTGNGSADGPFVYTGFKPAFVILKRTDGVANWQLNDSARDTFNVVNKRLAPSTSEAEATNFNFGDFLSNGFKIRQTDQTWNASGASYIYMAFAENPLVAGNYVPTTAR